MKISKTILPAAALVALFAGCQDENMGFTSQDVKEAKYAQTFEELFGKVDPNQDWSMAKQVNLTLSNAPEGILEVFYQNPINSRSVVLALKKVENGEVSVNFDMDKNVDRVFVRINKGNGFYELNNYYDVVDGQVILGETTRTDVPTGESRVTKGTPFSIKTQTLDISKVGTRLELYKGEAGLAVDWIDGYYRNIPQTQYERVYNVWRAYEAEGKATDFYKLDEFTNIIPLNDVITADDERPRIFWADIAPFFAEIDGNKPLFTEKENHVKYMKPGSDPQLDKDLVFCMAEDGPLYLDYFFKGTDFHNQFGYFYYTGNMTPELFKTTPKFVLVDNMTLATSPVTMNYTNETTKDWDLLKGVNYADATVSLNGLDWSDETKWGNCILGTRFQLTYFGADGSATKGSYTFPEGTKIGLFILGTVESGRSDAGSDGTIITSLANLNLQLYNECPHAASFSTNGQTVFAMEDMLTGSDYDLNDVMFFVNGPIEEVPEITPQTYKSETWIVACEDLGGSFDYDFNDLVFGIEKELLRDKDGVPTGKADIKLYPFAAGGTKYDQIIFNGKVIGEVHNLISGNETFDAPLNAEGGSAPAAGTAVTLATEIDAGISINSIMQSFSVRVSEAKDAEESIDNKVGAYNLGFNFDKKKTNNVPQMLLLPQGWDWPSEETTITEIYPQFKDWAGNMDDLDWIDNNNKESKADKVVTNPMKPTTPADPDPTDPTPAEPTDPVVKDAWKINIEGSNEIAVNGTNTYIVTIDGVSDTETLSKLTFTTYAPDVAEIIANPAPVVADGKVTLQVKGKLPYSTQIAAKMPEDDTHRATRKTITVTVKVTKPEPVLILSTTSVGLEVDASAEFNITSQAWNTWSSTKVHVESLDPTIATITVLDQSSHKYKVTGVAKGTTRIKVWHEDMPFDQHNAYFGYAEKFIDVKVGTISDAEVEITSAIGTVITGEKDAWGTSLILYPVDITSMDIEWPMGGSLVVEGSGDGAVTIFDMEKNYKKESYSTLNNVNPLTIDASSIANAKKFYIGCKGTEASSLNITKLTLKYKTISVE